MSPPSRRRRVLRSARVGVVRQLADGDGLGGKEYRLVRRSFSGVGSGLEGSELEGRPVEPVSPVLIENNGSPGDRFSLTPPCSS